MKSYDSDEPSKYIVYKDVNNLFEWVMSKYYPFVGYKWLTLDEVNKLDVKRIQGDNPESCISEEDLVY